MESPYMVATEAADFLRTPINTLYQWRHRGEGPPSVRIGRKLLYRRDQLEAWVESHDLSPQSATGQ